MLWNIVLGMVILWLLGLLGNYAAHEGVHFLLLIAIVILVIRESIKNEVTASTTPARMSAKDGARQEIKKRVRSRCVM